MTSEDNDAVQPLLERFYGRDVQIHQVSLLLNPSLPSPQAVILHGLPSTGKSSILSAVLESTADKLAHAIIPCRECITTRQLLERTIADVLDALIIFEQHHSDFSTINNDPSLDASTYPRTENVAALAVQLERLLSKRTEKFILAFDNVDALYENPGSLLPALVRIAECIPNLTLAFTMTTPTHGMFQCPGLAYVHFPAYTRDQALAILALSPQRVYPETHGAEIGADEMWLWSQYITAVWDSLAHVAARDIPSFRDLCVKLWPVFTQPVRDGKCKIREFSRLMIAHRALFQKDDALLDDIATAPTTNQPDKEALHTQETAQSSTLPPFAIYILCAAYLASYNPPRTDIVYFSEWSEKKKKRKRKSHANSAAPASAVKAKAGHRPIARQHLPPSTFSLARLLAILSAIYPHPVTSASHPATIPEVYHVDVLCAIATLSSARLLLKSGGGGDPLDEGARWRVNVGWEVVARMGRGVGVELLDWMAD